ncbi:MAG: nucleotidyltransferase family protein [Pseudomonadota bacterium]
MTPVGILLAAGRGSRFDPTGERNKLLAITASGDAVAVASARALLAVLPRVIACVSDDAVGAALRKAGCAVTHCAEATRGMSASLAHALRCSPPGTEGWLVALGDMPYVQGATLLALCAALEQGADIAVPVCGGQRGNPVGFSAKHLPALLALEGDQGARAIVRSHPVVEVPVDDTGIFRDIDTSSDL